MKFKAFLPALAAASVFISPASAAIMIDGIGSTSPIASNNDFAGALSSTYSYTSQANNFSSISLTAPAQITFYALASESGYNNSFSANGVSGSESEFAFDTSRVIGSVDLPAGALSDLKFTSNHGTDGVAGGPQLAVFLPSGFSGSSFSSDWVVFGYDDTAGGDADFDDFIVGAQISAVPEAHIWALMIVGFGLVGLQLRRNRNKSPQIAC